MYIMDNDRRQMTNLAYELQKDLFNSLPQEKKSLKLDREALMDIGHKVWLHSYKDSSDDGEAFIRLWDHYRETSTVLAGMLLLPCDQITLLGAARWADQGFPQVTMGHKYAAALMATNVPEEMAAEVRPPWPAFIIEIPDGLLPILNAETGKEVPLRRVLVHYVHTKNEEGQYSHKWQYVAFTDENFSIWKHGVGTAELASSNKGGNGVWNGEAFALPVEGLDEATSLLLGKLIVNVCLAMSDPSNVKTRPENGSVGSVPKNRTNKIRSFKLGKEIVLDARQALNDFIHGRKKGTAPSVQTIVRGHWKPKLAERVGHPVWVEPYSRGPEDGPILVRPVRLK